MFGVVLITCPSSKAESLARTILENRVASSVNMIHRVSSLYWWENRITCSDETLLVAKTRTEIFDKLKAIVIEMHPYEVPQIVLIPITAGNKDYLDWIEKETRFR